MDIDVTTRTFTLPNSTLATLERLARIRNSAVDNTLAAAIAEAERQWRTRWPIAYGKDERHEG